MTSPKGLVGFTVTYRYEYVFIRESVSHVQPYNPGYNRRRGDILLRGFWARAKDC